MKLSLLPIVLSLTALTSAACTDNGQQYNAASSFNGPNNCVPTGYYQASNLGQTTQSLLQSQCKAQCVTSGSTCTGYVGVLHKAADSALMTGECFFYSIFPSSPRSCVDYPSIIVAEAKDTTNQCFASSASVATAFCSSYLAIGTVTKYSTTIYPTTTLTALASTTSTTSTTSTSISISTLRFSTTVTSTLTYLSSTTTGTTQTVQTTTTARPLRVRAAASAPAPGCVDPNSLPASRLSSACSCLNIVSTTITTASTAPTFTSTVSKTLSFKATARTTTQTTTSTSTTSTLSTITTTSLTQSFTSTSTTTILTTVTPVPPSERLLNRDLESGGSANWNLYTYQYTTSSYPNDASKAESGNYYYKGVLSDAGSSGFCTPIQFKQTVTVVPGTTFTLSFHYQLISGTSCRANIGCEDGSYTNLAVSQGTSAALHGYTKYIASCTPQSTSMLVKFWVSCYSAGVFYLDNFSAYG